MALAFREAHGRATAIAATAVMVFYVWAAALGGNPFRRSGISAGYYDLLTKGFLAHHLYAALDPVPELLALPDPFDPVANARYRVHDLSLYRGRYYLYFGPVPVLTLLLPWRVITGKPLGDDGAALIFATAGYIFTLLLLFGLLSANGVRPSGFLCAAAAVTLGMGTYAASVLRDPGVYGVAIAAGYCFFAAGMYVYARAMVAERPQRWLAAAAGLLIGLTPGCRPQYALAAVILCVFYIWQKRPRRAAIWFCAPIAICGLSLMGYNFARFGNPLEFGTSYQLTGSVATRGVSLHLANLADGLYYLLLSPPAWRDQFPFIAPRFVVSTPRFFVENATGLLAISPLAAVGLVLPVWIGRWLRRGGAGRATAFVLAAFYAGAVAVLLFISLTGFSAGRYLLDFSPALLAIAMFGWLGWAPSQVWLRRGVAGAIVAGSVWTAVAGVALSVGYNDLLRDRSPRLYRRLARWSGRSDGSIRLPVDGLTLTAAVRFPAQPGGMREGLLVSGRPGGEDCLFVEYMGGNEVRFGYDKAVVGVTTGPRVAIEPGREYRLDVWYSGTDRRLVVSLDGVARWNTPADFYPTSLREIAFGRGAPGMSGVYPFSGRLRGPAQFSLYAAGSRATVSYP